MSYKTAAIGVLVLAGTACGGLGNPGDDATASNPFATTTAVPPWMGSDTGMLTSSGGQGATQADTSTSGVSDSATSGAPTSTSTSTSTGEMTGTISTGGTDGPDAPPKLDLPPSMSTGSDEDKDKDEDDEDKDEDDEDKDRDDD